MIIRVFRVIINPELREDFETKFADISVNTVQSQEGFVSVSIGKPTKWSPDEYLMISKWENEESLEHFAGIEWNHAHIPAGMEKFVQECSVHHYYEF